MSTRCYPIDGSDRFDVEDETIAGYKMKPGELAGALGFIPNSLTVGRVASRKVTSTFMVNGIECRIETLEDKITRLEGGG